MAAPATAAIPSHRRLTPVFACEVFKSRPFMACPLASQAPAIGELLSGYPIVVVRDGLTTNLDQAVFDPTGASRPSASSKPMPCCQYASNAVFSTIAN